MKSKLFLAAISTSIVLYSCGNGKTEKTENNSASTEESISAQYDDTLKSKLSVFAALPATAVNNDNTSTPQKIALGQRLYFDKQLSKDGNISCNSCHNLTGYGVDNLPTSPGDAGKNGDRNSPTVLNAALHNSQFWDGRAKDVEEQAGMPILNPVEMAIPSKQFLIDRLSKIADYQKLFKEAFPDEKQPLSYDNLQKAIASFERQLLTPDRFDKYLAGDTKALTIEEKKGLNTFIKVGCTACHNGAAIGGNIFQKFGISGNYWDYTKSKKIDEGRFSVTKQEADKYQFKVPSLRNIEKTSPYFHDGSVESLENAVEIMAKTQLNYQLSVGEKESIVAFLKSLTGELPVQYQAAK
ncbi:MAG: cytochrome-c peroxidase [Bacteroidia bacterium]|nr:cytochrome-c peroxidase [Bacteroidia bacterium]